MSVDYHAYAVMGVLLPKIPKAMKKSRKPAFKHDYEDDGKVEYHPKTGMKLWLEETIEVPADYPGIVFLRSYIDSAGKEQDEYASPLREGQTLIRIPVHLSLVHDTHSETTYVGYIARANTYGHENSARVKIPPYLNLIEDELRKLLEPHGLWREDRFGLYSVLFCSF